MANLTKTDLNLLYLAALGVAFPELDFPDTWTDKGRKEIGQTLLKLDEILADMDKKGL